MLVGSWHQEGGAGRAFAKATGSNKAKQHGKDVGEDRGAGWDLEGTWEACPIGSSPVPSLELCRAARHWMYLISPHNCTA